MSQILNDAKANGASSSSVRIFGRHGRIDFDAINKAALGVLLALLTRWLPDGRRDGREYVARNPRRADRKPGSFKINLDRGVWRDFAADVGGSDPVSLAAYLGGISQAAAARELVHMLGMHHE